MIIIGRGNQVLNATEVELAGGERALRVTGSVSSGGEAQEITTSQDLSIAPLNYTTSVGDNFIVKGIYLTFTSSTTQTITIEYNGVKLIDEEITGQTARVCGGFTIYGGLGKELTITCTNTGTPAITVDVIIDIEVI